MYLSNLVRSETCFMNNHKSTIDLILTNKPRSFQVTNVTETGVSHCHKLITTFMKSYISRLLKVHYCKFENLPICSRSNKSNTLKISHSYS